MILIKVLYNDRLVIVISDRDIHFLLPISRNAWLAHDRYHSCVSNMDIRILLLSVSFHPCVQEYIVFVGLA